MLKAPDNYVQAVEISHASVIANVLQTASWWSVKDDVHQVMQAGDVSMGGQFCSTLVVRRLTPNSSSFLP